MANSTKLPKRLATKVTRVWFEGSDGYWADLAKGWECVLNETHTCHEMTMPELKHAIALAERCSCSECK